MKALMDTIFGVTVVFVGFQVVLGILLGVSWLIRWLG